MAKKRNVGKTERVSYRWDLGTVKVVLEIAEQVGWSESKAAAFLVHGGLRLLRSSCACGEKERAMVAAYRDLELQKQKGRELYAVAARHVREVLRAPRAVDVRHPF